MKYDPKEYWEIRLKNYPDLRGVGCVGFSETYNKYLYSLKVLALEKALNDYSIIVKGKLILDVGCDTGFFVDYYRKKGAKKIVGIDIAETSISLLRKKYPTYNFFIADISEVQFEEKFDIVNAFDVLYHITHNNKFKKAIDNISTACAEGGYILITDVFGKEDYMPAEHVHYRSLNTYQKLLYNHGIKIPGIIPMYYLMGRSIYLPAFLLNKLCRIFYLVDKILQSKKIPNGKNLKLLVGYKIENE